MAPWVHISHAIVSPVHHMTGLHYIQVPQMVWYQLAVCLLAPLFPSSKIARSSLKPILTSVEWEVSIHIHTNSTDGNKQRLLPLHRFCILECCRKSQFKPTVDREKRNCHHAQIQDALMQTSSHI